MAPLGTPVVASIQRVLPRGCLGSPFSCVQLGCTPSRCCHFLGWHLVVVLGVDFVVVLGKSIFTAFLANLSILPFSVDLLFALVASTPVVGGYRVPWVDRRAHGWMVWVE